LRARRRRHTRNCRSCWGASAFPRIGAPKGARRAIGLKRGGSWFDWAGRAIPLEGGIGLVIGWGASLRPCCFRCAPIRPGGRAFPSLAGGCGRSVASHGAAGAPPRRFRRRSLGTGGQQSFSKKIRCSPLVM
jgi:hypothetical protein